MRSRWLLILGALLLASASCAQGSAFTGVGGLGGFGGQPSDTTSGHPSSNHASTGAGAGGSTTSSTTSGPSPTSSTSGVGGSCPSPCKLTEPQCGCPTGEECGINAGSVACVPEGFDALGQACGTSASDRCGPGMTCVGIAPSGTVGQCEAFCDSDTDCIMPGGLCLVELSDGTPTGSIPGVTLCTANCDPITNSGCPTGTACQILQESAGQMRLLTDCRSAGTKGSKVTCDPALYDCAPGFACANVCAKYCDAAAPSCPAGTSCTYIATLDTTDYGVCL